MGCGAGDALGAGGILTSQPFAAGGGLRAHSSAGRALQGGPVTIEVSTSDLGVRVVAPGERGDGEDDVEDDVEGDVEDDVEEEPAGDAPVEASTRLHGRSKETQRLLPSHSGLHDGPTGYARPFRSKTCCESTP